MAPSTCSLVLLLAFRATAVTVPVSNATLETRACRAGFDSYAFCNASLAVDVRIADLVLRLHDNEIPPQLTARHNGGDSHGPESNVSRIGLPTYDWGLNAIHGLQSSCLRDAGGTVYCPTSFMNPVNFGSAWNASLAREMGAVIAAETRAAWLAGATEESAWSGRPVIGLNVWSPTINIARDPRWGRCQETPSEDPMINGDYGSAYTLGVQLGEDARFLKLISTLKHWDAYSFENATGFTRHNFNAVVSNYSLQDTYWPAFRSTIARSSPGSAMCSYNSVNGVPACANAFLTQTVLRGAWGFRGFVTSDTGAIEDIYQQHKYVNGSEAAACAAIADGTTDLSSGVVYLDSLMAAVAAGRCPRAAVNAALNRTLAARFSLGLFDPVDDQPYWHVPVTTIGAPAAAALNYAAALQSMVILKNLLLLGPTPPPPPAPARPARVGMLPLTPGVRVAVVGPHANATGALVGSYTGQVCPDDSMDCVPSLIAALAAANVGGVTHMARGCDLAGNDTSAFAEAVDLARGADVVVLALGLGESLEGESLDRSSLALPAVQAALGAAVLALGRPAVLVLLSGAVVDISDPVRTGVGSILYAGYPGFAGARAIAATLFGDNEHCCGKLATTWYGAEYADAIAPTEMELDVGVGRGYRYFNGSVQWPFGYGLALTRFVLSGVALPVGPLHTEAAPSSMLPFVVNVTNVGDVAGDEVVQLYAEPRQPLPAQPRSRLLRRLVAYRRVHLEPGATEAVAFSVSTETLRVVDRDTGDVVSTPGTWALVATNGVAERVATDVVVEGDEVVVEPFPGRGLE